MPATATLKPLLLKACPTIWSVIVGKVAPATKSQVAEQNVLDLDLAMFGIYDQAQTKFQKNFLAQHPVIMALFSAKGGKPHALPSRQGSVGGFRRSDSLPAV